MNYHQRLWQKRPKYWLIIEVLFRMKRFFFSLTYFSRSSSPFKSSSIVWQMYPKILTVIWETAWYSLTLPISWHFSQEQNRPTSIRFQHSVCFWFKKWHFKMSYSQNRMKNFESIVKRNLINNIESISLEHEWCYHQ